MKLLAIDTSTETCSAALYFDGEIRERSELAPRRHAELILPMIDQLLTDMGTNLRALDTLVLGRGPGSFTGVRIAAGVIQGLAFAADLPVVPISSLAALAQGAADQAKILCSAIDARMEEIYWGWYEVSEDGLVTPILDEKVTKPELIEVPGQLGCFGAGSGWDRYGSVLRQKIGACLSGYAGDRYPLARDMIPLAIRDFKRGYIVDSAQAVPVYLRNEVTGKK